MQQELITAPPTTQSQPKRRVVNVTTRKQATWIKCNMRQTSPLRLSKPEWKQNVTRLGTANPPKPEDIIASYPQSEAKSPLEIWKLHGNNAVVWWQRLEAGTETAASPAKTQDELAAQAFRVPASSECILAHLLRMSGHLHVKGAGGTSDGTQSAFLITDYTDRLLEAKVLEVDLFLACEHLIEATEDGFFPTFAKLKRQIDSIAKN